jgi:hypothetical protein
MYITLVCQCGSEVLLGEEYVGHFYEGAHALFSRRLRTVFEMPFGPGFMSALCSTMTYAILEMLDNLNPVVGTHIALLAIHIAAVSDEWNGWN